MFFFYFKYLSYKYFRRYHIKCYERPEQISFSKNGIFNFSTVAEDKKACENVKSESKESTVDNNKMEELAKAIENMTKQHDELNVSRFFLHN